MGFHADYVVSVDFFIFSGHFAARKSLSSRLSLSENMVNNTENSESLLICRLTNVWMGVFVMGNGQRCVKHKLCGFSFKKLKEENHQKGLCVLQNYGNTEGYNFMIAPLRAMESFSSPQPSICIFLCFAVHAVWFPTALPLLRWKYQINTVNLWAIIWHQSLFLFIIEKVLWYYSQMYRLDIWGLINPQWTCTVWKQMCGLIWVPQRACSKGMSNATDCFKRNPQYLVLKDG